MKKISPKYLVEFLLIFIGIYTAFLFDRYQDDQEELKQLQILIQFLEEETENIYDGLTYQLDNYDKNIFTNYSNRREIKNYVPRQYFNHFPTAADNDIWTTILQDGGIKAFDFKLLKAIRHYIGTQSALYYYAALFSDYSITLLAPNAHLGYNEFFSKSGSVKPKYWWYDSMVNQVRLRLENHIESAKALHEQLKLSKESLQD